MVTFWGDRHKMDGYDSGQYLIYSKNYVLQLHQ